MYRTARASARDLSFVAKDLHLSVADISYFKTLYDREKQKFDEFKAQVFNDNSKPLHLCTDHIRKRDVDRGISYLNSIQMFGLVDQLRGFQGHPRGFFEIPGMAELDGTSIQQAVDQGVRYDYQELTPRALAWLTRNVPETEDVIPMTENASPVSEFIQQPQRPEEQDEQAVKLPEPQGRAVFNDEGHQAQDANSDTPTLSNPLEDDADKNFEVLPSKGPGSKSSDTTHQEGSYGSSIRPEHDTPQTSHCPGAAGEVSRDTVVPSETFVVVPHDLVVVPYNPAEAIGQAKAQQDAVEALDDKQAMDLLLMGETIEMANECGLDRQAFEASSDRKCHGISELDAPQGSDGGQAAESGPQEAIQKADQLTSQLDDASVLSFDKAFGSPVPSDHLQVDPVTLNRPESPKEDFDSTGLIRVSSSPPPADHEELKGQLALPLFPHLLYTERPNMFAMLKDAQKKQYWQCPESLTMSLRHDKDPATISFTGSWHNPTSVWCFEPQKTDKSGDAPNGSASEPYERYEGWWELVPLDDDTEAILGDNVDNQDSLVRESSPVAAFERDTNPAANIDVSGGPGSNSNAPIALDKFSAPFVFPSGYGDHSAWPFEKTGDKTTVTQPPELFPQRLSSSRQPSLEGQQEMLRHQRLARSLFPEDEDEPEQSTLNRVAGRASPEGTLFTAASHVTGGHSTAAGEKVAGTALRTPSAVVVSHGRAFNGCPGRATPSRLPGVIGGEYGGPNSATEAGTQYTATELTEDTSITQSPVQNPFEQSLQQDNARRRRGRARKVASDEPEANDNKVIVESDDDFHGIFVPVAEDDDGEYMPEEPYTPTRAQKKPKTSRTYKKRQYSQPGTGDPSLGRVEGQASASAGPNAVASHETRGLSSSEIHMPKSQQPSPQGPGDHADQQRPYQQEPHQQMPPLVPVPPPSHSATSGVQRSESTIFGPFKVLSEPGHKHAYYVVAGQVLKVAEPKKGRRTNRFHLKQDTIEKIARGDVPKHLALPRVERDLAAQAIIAAVNDSSQTLPPLPDWFPQQVAETSARRRPRKAPSPLRDIPSFDLDAESFTPAMGAASQNSGRERVAACGSFGIDLQPHVNVATPSQTQAAADRTTSVQAESSMIDPALFLASGDSTVPVLGSVPPSENRSIMEQVSFPGPEQDMNTGHSSNTQPAGVRATQAPTLAQDTSRSQAVDDHAQKPQKPAAPKGAKRKNPIDETTGKRARGRPRKYVRTMDSDTAVLSQPSTSQPMLHDAPPPKSQPRVLDQRAVPDGDRAVTTSLSRPPDEGRQAFLDAFCSGAPIPDPGEIRGPQVPGTALGVPKSVGTNANTDSYTTQSRLLPASGLALVPQAGASSSTPSVSTSAGVRGGGRGGGRGRGRGNWGGSRRIQKRVPSPRKFDYSRVSFAPIRLNPDLLRSTPMFPFINFFDDDELDEEMDEV